MFFRDSFQSFDVIIVFLWKWVLSFFMSQSTEWFFTYEKTGIRLSKCKLRRIQHLDDELLCFYWLISYTIDMKLIDQACDWFECLKTRRINLIDVNQNKLCICDDLWAQTGGRPMHWKSFVFYRSKVFWSHQFTFNLWHWIVHLICGYTRKLFMILYRYSFLLVAREPENNKKKKLKKGHTKHLNESISYKMI